MNNLKTWQKASFAFFAVAVILYVQRDRVKKGVNYARAKFGKLIEAFSDDWIGVKELGNNREFGNSVFQSMLKNVGWKSYDQWCMYFAKAIHYQVYKKDREAIKKILTGNTQDSFNRVKKDTSGVYKAIESGSAKKGDIAIWQRTGSPGTGHAGVVVRVNGDGTMNTIEGNTSDKSISDGDTVARKVRPATIGKTIPGSTLKLRGFIRKV